MTSDPMAPGSLPARLYAKWQRERDASLSLRVSKAASYSYDLARARLYLRNASSVASDVRVMGRPIVNNDGTLIIGDRTIFRSIVAPVELAVVAGAEMTIGAESHINSGTSICAFRLVTIGQRVEVAPYVSIYDTNFHQVYNRSAMPDPKPVVIEDDVWLCAKCTVLPGVTIGRGAIVQPHALVMEDVEPFTIVSGIPARVVKRLDPSRFSVTPPN